MHRSLSRFHYALLAGLLGILTLIWPMSAQADAGSVLTSGSAAELQASLELTHDPQRLADLQALQQAIAASDDRAQISNQTSHNLGVFARYKKELPDAPAQFYVLGPGHETDDDYDILGLLVPPEVALGWADTGETRSVATPRVLRVLEGEQLAVSDPTTTVTNADAVVYQLSLPAFSVEASLTSIADMPTMNQEQLDQDAETAPLD